MTIEEMIKRYNIRLEMKFDNGKFIPTGRLGVYNTVLLQKDGAKDEVLSRKDEAKALLLRRYEDEQRAYEERQAKIAAIPGLKEIQHAIEDLTEWEKEFERSFDERYGAGCGGLGVRSHPNYDIKAMKAQYPRAAAYLEMFDWSQRDFIEQRIAGQKALEKIIDDDNWEQAVADAKKELDDYITEHIWD